MSPTLQPKLIVTLNAALSVQLRQESFTVENGRHREPYCVRGSCGGVWRLQHPIGTPQSCIDQSPDHINLRVARRKGNTIVSFLFGSKVNKGCIRNKVNAALGCEPRARRHRMSSRSNCDGGGNP